jgi:hypothetical protein
MTAPAPAGSRTYVDLREFRGTGANTCQGDSGGPLFVDLGSGSVLAGTTSGGFSVNCLPNDHSYDANLVVYRDWIAAAAAGDLGTSGCGGIPPVDTPGAIATEFTGELGPARPFALESVGVAPGTAELRVALLEIERSPTSTSRARRRSAGRRGRLRRRVGALRPAASPIRRRLGSSRAERGGAGLFSS